ncbi:MAG: hypothetical protein RIS82_724 [Actinomycetota bacterium]
MDVGATLFLVPLIGLVLWLPLIGKKWSVIVATFIYGTPMVLCSVFAFLMLSEPPAGPSHSFAIAYLWIAGISGSLIVLTFVIYGYRQRKQNGGTAKTTIK